MKEYEICALKNDSSDESPDASGAASSAASELQLCFPIMQELRTHLTWQDFFQLYKQAHQSEGYQLVVAKRDKKILGLMGYRILHDFVHGKHLYIDDLVLTKTQRSNGIGSALLQHAESLAKRHDCKSLRLSTGIENELGKKFYEKNAWTLRAVVYKKKL